MELRPTQDSHLPSPGQSFPKVNATYLNLLVLAAEMQQVQDSCDDHGSGDRYPAGETSRQHQPPRGLVHRWRGAVVTTFEITPGEQSAWQRRAARELAAILDAHPELPVIAWTAGSAGSLVVGHVNGLAPACLVRQVFDTWRTALTLTEHSESAGAGATCLRAARHRDRVQVRLTATVFDEDDRVVTS